jgi:hypothetical protein
MSFCSIAIEGVCSELRKGSDSQTSGWKESMTGANRLESLYNGGDQSG